MYSIILNCLFLNKIYENSITVSFLVIGPLAVSCKPASGPITKTIHPSKQKRQWKRLFPHLPAQHHLIGPKIARAPTHLITAKTLLGMMRMQNQRPKRSITQHSLQDVLLRRKGVPPAFW